MKLLRTRRKRDRLEIKWVNIKRLRQQQCKAKLRDTAEFEVQVNQCTVL